MITINGIIEIKTSNESVILKFRKKSLLRFAQKILPQIILDALKKEVSKKFPKGTKIKVNINGMIELWETTELNLIEFQASIDIYPKDVEEVLKETEIPPIKVKIVPYEENLKKPKKTYLN
jgi:transposase